jgi:hypothetical protein
MHEAGIYTNVWRSHALRGAAASDMHDKGLQLEMGIGEHIRKILHESEATSDILDSRGSGPGHRLSG